MAWDDAVCGLWLLSFGWSAGALSYIQIHSEVFEQWWEHGCRIKHLPLSAQNIIRNKAKVAEIASCSFVLEVTWDNWGVKKHKDVWFLMAFFSNDVVVADANSVTESSSGNCLGLGALFKQFCGSPQWRHCRSWKFWHWEHLWRLPGARTSFPQVPVLVPSGVTVATKNSDT